MEQLIQDYKNGLNLEEISKKYHFGKIKIKNILQENGVEIRKKGGQTIVKEYKVNDWRIEKYPPIEGYHYVAETKYESTNGSMMQTNDYMNKGGILTSFISQVYNVKIPTLYERRQYYMKNGDYWWEQWFNIFPIKNQEVKKCPYCDWETTDIDNKSGAFEKHLLVKHNITKEEYLKAHSEDEKYFEKKEKQVKCKKSPIDTLSFEFFEIKQYINQLGFQCFFKQKNKQCGVFGLFIPSLNIAIDYNFNYWHQNSYLNDSSYHLDKLEKCNAKGIKLLQIFEDEYKLHKEIVLSKIENMLNLTKNRLYARQCSVKEITYKEAKAFLNDNHIQGFAKSSVYLGSYYQDKLIGVMTFLREQDNHWELNRFATLLHYNIVGLGSKLLKYFINNYQPKEIKSFADRRWTLDKDKNLYTNLGFKLSCILPPDYRYYNSKIDRYKRFHKFGFRKNILHKKYGFPLEMTENQMVEQLGFGKIYDCGLLKYVLSFS